MRNGRRETMPDTKQDTARPGPSPSASPPSISSRSGGILAAQGIQALHAAGAILPETPFAADQVQPASLDLRLGSRAFRVRTSFLPGSPAGLRLYRGLRPSRDRPDRRRGAGDRLRLHRRIAGDPGPSGGRGGQRQSEELHRAASMCSPASSPTGARPSIRSRRATRAGSMPKSRRALSRSACAQAHACRRSASVAVSRACPMPNSLRCIR